MKQFLGREEEYLSKREKGSCSRKREKEMEGKKVNPKKKEKKRRKKEKESAIDAFAFAEARQEVRDLPTLIVDAEKKAVSLWVEGLNKEGKPFFIKPKNYIAVKKLFALRDSLMTCPRCKGLLNTNKYFQRLFLFGFSLQKIKAVDGSYISVLKREDGKYDFRYFEFLGFGIKLYDHNPKNEGNSNLYMFKKHKRGDGKTQKYFICLSSSKQIKEETIIRMAGEGLE